MKENMRMKQDKSSQNIRQEDDCSAPYDPLLPPMSTLWHPLGPFWTHYGLPIAPYGPLIGPLWTIYRPPMAPYGPPLAP